MLLGACPGNWRARDTVLESTAVVLTVVDWQQTKSITANCSEINPIIGKCGQRMNMHAYFISVLILEVVVSRLLPTDWRSTFHGVWIGVEATTVYDNGVD